MSRENPNRLTLVELKKLLESLDFVQANRLERCVVFHHPASGVLIVLPDEDPNAEVRAADLLSVHFRLATHGLASQSTLDALATGRLPAA